MNNQTVYVIDSTEKEKQMTNSIYVRRANRRLRTSLIIVGVLIVVSIGLYRADSQGWQAAAAQEQATQASEHLADMAKDGCRQTVQLNEDFPSTVSFDWFGTTLIHRPQSASFNVMVDYTAKNSTGATLPYTMLCWSDDAGNIVEHQRAGR